MRRSRLAALVTASALVLAGAAVMWTAGPASAAANTATFTKTSDWGSGWEGKVTVTNGGTTPLTSWTVAFDLPAGTSVSSAWEADVSAAGTRWTFRNKSYNGTIAGGASLTFGLIGAGPGSPSNCTLNGASCGGGGVVTPPVSPTASPTPPPTTPPPTTPPPTTPPPTTTPPPAGPLPKHFLTGYWHNFVNNAVELRLRDTPAQYDLVAVSFAEATSTPGAVTFGVDPQLSTALGGYSDADFRADVRALQARGTRVILSVGGEAGRVSVADAASATRFSDTMFSIMQSYGFDGVDIDLENGLNPTYMAQALRSLRSRIGANMIITMAPQTIDMQSTAGSYFALALAIKDILTVVHTQFYNSGSMLGCDQMAAYGQGTINFLTALACIQLENGLRPDQVALGLPAGPGAASGGVMSPSVVNAALDCLARATNCGSFRPPRTYPGIRGAMTWSINWDVTNGNGFANTVGPHLDTLP
ncbi:chitinase [Catenuloplanes atrovinosus]|uniref:chitinase n=1 Tax=Catenuloplanes atrovinosus TaxID=137266 RepID=A0AAE3YKQ6_9ACTN|nr:cellulose binding domain-containing protein [Catenuloplanes atrovinosus]MDR7274702.1 chitinase [Catenuloplanes atrovinosus]